MHKDLAGVCQVLSTSYLVINNNSIIADFAINEIYLA